MTRALVGLLGVLLFGDPSITLADESGALLPAREASGAKEASEDKKAAWLAEKATRVEHRTREPPVATADRPLSLRNVWTDEILPLPTVGPSPAAQADFERLLRCHFTQDKRAISAGLLPLVQRAAAHFRRSLVEIVSGYRAPKYQLILRKKGHEVARDSAHPRGQAVDFRIPSVPVRALLAFVRRQRLGGVGFYPESQFVHADTGPVRFWKGH